MRIASYVSLCVLSLGIALYAIGAYALVPLGALLHPDMRASFQAHAISVYTHIFASAIALAIGPLQFSSRLRASKPRMHRWFGRVYLGLGVLFGGLAGLYMALHAFGGYASRVGFACLALAWLFTGLRAFLAIRRGDVVSHRRWMVRNFALTFAAVTLRLYLPISMGLGIAFEVAYPVIAWLCWVPNILIAELFFNRTQTPAPQRSALPTKAS
jgi:uncharacterized membrane protein